MAATPSPSTATFTCSSTRMSGSSCHSTAPARKALRSRCAIALFDDFADRYFPEAPNAVKADPKDAKADAEKLAGVYSTTRGSATNFLAIADLIGQAKVGVDKDGNPLIDAAKGLNGQPRKWIHIGPMVWRDADGHDLLTANVADGKVTRFSWGELAPIIDFARTPAYRSSAWILPLLYVLAGDPLPDAAAVADAGAGAAQIQGRARPRTAAALGLSLQPHRGHRHPRGSDRLGGRHPDAVRRPWQ